MVRQRRKFGANDEKWKTRSSDNFLKQIKKKEEERKTTMKLIS